MAATVAGLAGTPTSFAADEDKPVVPMPVAAAERKPLAPFGKVRELDGDERNRAIEARDKADLARAAHERKYRAGPRYPKDDPDVKAEFELVAAAYRLVAITYPGTEYDCYCRLRLAGAYQYRGEFDRAVDEAKQAAELFGGTEKGLEAEHSVGLIYLQALHDPQKARQWFVQVQAAAAAMQDEQLRGKWQTAAAQGIARCDEALRKK